MCSLVWFFVASDFTTLIFLSQKKGVKNEESKNSEITLGSMFVVNAARFFLFIGMTFVSFY